ncbi:MAG: Ppx/GppA family phosphatase [Fusobacteriales bacterium]|jgi:exopolyphosphatase/guanosine-5'-triphosphate,3'-diphosphate pyrophosphatase|nr:Ppx/GppA family phosphatase [Fusobacteriales bacterium]
MIASIIDIGTNSCRLMIADSRNNTVNPLIKKVEFTRLGEGVNKTKMLAPEAINRTLKVLKEYKKISDSYNSEKISAFATSAVRDSSNREVFLELVKKECGIAKSCITGIEEGTAAFVGGTNFLNSLYSKVLLIDIGGGSTEFSYGVPKKIPEHVKSFDLGAVRFKEMLEEGTAYQELENHINNELSKIDFITGDFELLGVAASITGQIALYYDEIYDPEKSHNKKLTLDMIKDNFHKLSKMSVEEITQLPSINAKRADVITSGTFLLLKILEYFNKEYILTSEIDLLEGHFILNILN